MNILYIYNFFLQVEAFFYLGVLSNCINCLYGSAGPDQDLDENLNKSTKDDYKNMVKLW